MIGHPGRHNTLFSDHKAMLWNIIPLAAAVLIAFSADLFVQGRLPGRLSWWGKCLGEIAAAGFPGYEDSLQVLSDNYAVIISVVSVAVVVYPFIIADREKKVFGIRRDELKMESKGSRCVKWMVRILTCMPVALLIVVMAGWCVTGYTLLFYTLSGMVVIFFYYLRSHLAEAEEEELADLFFHYTENIQSCYSGNIMEYREMLEDMEAGAVKGNDWHDAAKVLKKLMKKAGDKPPKQAYAAVTLYVSVIYRHHCEDHRNCLLQIYNIWLEYIGGKQGKSKEMLLWAILSGAISWASAENVCAFLECYCNLVAGERRYYEQAGEERPWADKTVEDGIVLVFLECWLRREHADFHNSCFPACLGQLFKGAYGAMAADGEPLRGICAENYQNVFTGDTSVKKALDSLLYDTSEMTVMSVARTVLMLEGML